MIVCPAVVGGGKRFFPAGVRLALELVEERRFRKGRAASPVRGSPRLIEGKGWRVSHEAWVVEQSRIQILDHGSERSFPWSEVYD